MLSNIGKHTVRAYLLYIVRVCWLQHPNHEQ